MVEEHSLSRNSLHLMPNDAILNIVYSLVAFNIGFAGFLNGIPIKMEKVSDLTPL